MLYLDLPFTCLKHTIPCSVTWTTLNEGSVQWCNRTWALNLGHYDGKLCSEECLRWNVHLILIGYDPLLIILIQNYLHLRFSSVSCSVPPLPKRILKKGVSL
jgi:hypothetical protein